MHHAAQQQQPPLLEYFEYYEWALRPIPPFQPPATLVASAPPPPCPPPTPMPPPHAHNPPHPIAATAFGSVYVKKAEYAGDNDNPTAAVVWGSPDAAHTGSGGLQVNVGALSSQFWHVMVIVR